MDITTDREMGHDGAQTVPFQPQPINTRISYVAHQGRVRTAVAREWRLRDAERCRLCPAQCRASVSTDGTTAMCLMVAPRRLTLDEARLFSPIGFVASSDVGPDNLGIVAETIEGQGIVTSLRSTGGRGTR